MAETWLGFRVCVALACSEPVDFLRWVPRSPYKVSSFLWELCLDFQRPRARGPISLLHWRPHLLGKLALEGFLPALLWKSHLPLSSGLPLWSWISWVEGKIRRIQLSGAGSISGTCGLCWQELEAHHAFPSLIGGPAEVSSWSSSFLMRNILSDCSLEQTPAVIVLIFLNMENLRTLSRLLQVCISLQLENLEIIYVAFYRWEIWDFDWSYTTSDRARRKTQISWLLKSVLKSVFLLHCIAYLKTAPANRCKAGFLQNSSLWGLIWALWMVSNISGICSLNANNISPPSCDKHKCLQVFPGGLVVRIQHFHHCSLSSVSLVWVLRSHMKVLHATAKKKKKKKSLDFAKCSVGGTTVPCWELLIKGSISLKKKTYLC